MSDEEQEIVSAKITDRRRFKEEEILIREDRMSIFKRESLILLWEDVF